MSHPTTILVLAVLSTAISATASAQCDWVHTFPPTGSGDINRLWDISARSSDDAWAVSFLTGQGAQLIRYNGDAWSHVASGPSLAGLPGPFPSSGPNLQLTGVAALSSGEVYVGGRADASLPSFYVGWPIVARWDGSNWSDVQQIDLGTIAQYPFYARGGVIENFSTSPDGDIWGFGTCNSGPDSPGVANILTVRFHDGAWSHIPFPIGFSRINVAGDVLAFAADDAWLVGYGNNSGATSYMPIVAHWNGSAWSSVATPISGSTQVFITCITGTSSSDIWVAGETPGGALFMHFDGSTWEQSQSPVGTTTRISEIAAASANEVWAWSNLAQQGYRFDGASWTVATIPTPPGTVIVGLSEMKPVPASSSIWTAGTLNLGSTQTAALRLGCLETCPADFNHDGGIDGSDLAAFFAEYEAGTGAADVDNNGGVDGGDLGFFVQVFEAGGC